LGKIEYDSVAEISEMLSYICTISVETSPSPPKVAGNPGRGGFPPMISCDL
jgi:hypothetical protein